MDRNNSNSNSIGSLGPNKSNNSNASISSNNNVGMNMTHGHGMNMNNINGNGMMMMNNSNGNMTMAMPMEPSGNGNVTGNNPNGHGPMLDRLDGGAPSNTILGLTLLMEQPVIEEMDDDDELEQRANGATTHWEYHNVNLQRIPGYGFGIAVSGGRDNPHFANGDPSIAISDVLKGGPAEGKLSVNDRILSANGVNLENVDYATAVQVLRDNSNVQLVIKRRTIHHHQSNVFKVSVSKGQKKDFAIPLCTQLVIKEARATLQPGDIILKINSTPAENLSAKEAKRLIESKDKLELVIQRNSNVNQTSASTVNQNLYVQQPRRADVTTGSVPHLIPPPPPRPSPPPPRPPPPVEDAMDGNSGAMTPYGLASPQQNSQTRVIKFKKVQSLGIRLAGGNTSGIYVSAVQPNSPASIQNLQPGDKILSVNGQDLSLFTREEAVQLLLNTHDDVELVVDSKGGVVGGDCFYIKTACDHATALKGELSFKKGEIFCVLDSLYGGTIGNWQVERMSTGEKGIIPNKSRFEETVSKSSSGLNTSFFKKKSPPIVYERVVFDRVPYTRPVVLLGVGASIARNRLMKEYPKEFQALDSPTTTLSYTRIRVSVIRNIINSNRHCIMSNISSPIDKLDQLYPIVILLKTDDKSIIKELGGGSSTLNGKNNWKKLEKNWGTSIHAVLEIIDSNWCSELKEIIDQEQSKCTWIREEDFKQQPTNQNPTEPDYLILNHDSSYISANELSSAMVASAGNNTSSNDAKISLPDYNAPPPYALGSNNSIDKKIEIAKLSTVTPDKYQKPNYNFVPALEPNSSSYSLGRNKILAHTPPPIPPPESRHMKSVEKPPTVDRTKKPERRQFDDPYAVFSDKLSYIHQNGGSPYSYTKSLPNHNHYNSNNTMSTDLNGNPLSSAVSLSPSPLLVPTIDQSYHSLTAGSNNASNTWKQQRGANGMMNSSNNNHMYDNHNASSTPTNFYQENNRITSNGNGNPYKMDNHRGNHRESSVTSPNNVYLTPPRPKMKPVPPPKPLKTIDLYSNTYLNVPTRRESAFQVYNGNNSNHRNSSSKSTSSSSNHHNSSNHNSHHNSSQNRKYVMLGHEDDLIRSPSSRSQAPLPPPPPNIQTVKKRLGTSGGSISLQGVLLEVPKGALDCKTEISMEIIEPVQSKGTFQSPIVALQPEGLTFQKPVKLSLPHWMNSDVTSYLKITNNDFVDATEDNHYIHVLLNSI